MSAELLIHDKVQDRYGGIIEVKIWSVPKSKDRPHGYKFSLVYISTANVFWDMTMQKARETTGIMAVKRCHINLKA